MHDNRHIVHAIYRHFSRLFIDRIDIHLIDIPSFISIELWPSCYDGGLVTLRRAMLGVRILSWKRFFCNVYLFRVPRSWTGSV